MKLFLIILSQFFVQFTMADDLNVSVVGQPEFICSESSDAGNKVYSELSVSEMPHDPKYTGYNRTFLVRLKLKGHENIYVNRYFGMDLEQSFNLFKNRDLATNIYNNSDEKDAASEMLSLNKSNQAIINFKLTKETPETFNCKFQKIYE